MLVEVFNYWVPFIDFDIDHCDDIVDYDPYGIFSLYTCRCVYGDFIKH